MKTKVFLIVLLFVISLGMMGNIFLIKNVNKQTEETTKEIKATIECINKSFQGDDICFEISVKEFDTKLYISPDVCTKINIDDIYSLQEKQEIFFRIENIWWEEFEESSFVEIVSLKTSEKNIFSLKDYNESISKDTNVAQIMGLIVAVIFFLIAICNLIRYKKRVS